MLPPDDADEITLGREDDGSLVIDRGCQPLRARRSGKVDIEIFERWRPTGRDLYERSDYKFEIRHHEMNYRRAYHRHDADAFLRAHDVVTHEHCETSLGYAACDHYFGEPVADAFGGFRRVYELWLADKRPDYSALPCLG